MSARNCRLPPGVCRRTWTSWSRMNTCPTRKRVWCRPAGMRSRSTSMIVVTTSSGATRYRQCGTRCWRWSWICTTTSCPLSRAPTSTPTPCWRTCSRRNGHPGKSFSRWTRCCTARHICSWTPSCEIDCVTWWTWTACSATLEASPGFGTGCRHEQRSWDLPSRWRWRAISRWPGWPRRFQRRRCSPSPLPGHRAGAGLGCCRCSRAA